MAQHGNAELSLADQKVALTGLVQVAYGTDVRALQPCVEDGEEVLAEQLRGRADHVGGHRRVVIVTELKPLRPGWELTAATASQISEIAEAVTEAANDVTEAAEAARRIVDSAGGQMNVIVDRVESIASEALERISLILLRRETIEADEFLALLAGTPEEDVFGPDEVVEPPPPADSGSAFATSPSSCACSITFSGSVFDSSHSRAFGRISLAANWRYWLF